MRDLNTHRELIAAIASLKSCVRSVILSVSGSRCSSTSPAGCRINGSLQRAFDAVGNLRRLLSAASDKTPTLPLSTSRRIVEVELPDLLEQLLSCCNPSAAWPLPHQQTTCGTSTQVDSNEVPCSTASTAAILHPSWMDVQQLIANVFEVLMLLCGLAVRACTRSSDPLVVLLQLSSARVMQACVTYMNQLWDVHMSTLDAANPSATAPATVDSAASCGSSTETAASSSFACAVSAFSSCYSLLAASVDAQPGLEEVELQLAKSLCATNFLATAVRLLFAASCPADQKHAFEVDCQHAGWHLLTIALFLSGGDIAISPAGPSSVELRPGQHIPSSILAAYLRQQGEQSMGTENTAPGPNGAVAASIAATEAATGLPLADMQQQLLGHQVLHFIEERLHHAVREMRGNEHTHVTCNPVPDQQSPRAKEGVVLLPGRCVPDDQDVLAAVLRTLRCWRALLAGPSGTTLPIASEHGVQLLVAVLNGTLAESVKDNSSERQALRGRLVRVAVHCLQLLCGCVEQHVLMSQLSGLTAALSKVVAAAGSYWDAHKRAIKSVDLPFTGQVRCVDKVTGDMMVRYTVAAESALAVLQQLLTACQAGQTAQNPAVVKASGAAIAGVMLSSGLLPPLEQLFRQVPGVSPAHVAAASLLEQVLPLSNSCDITYGQLPLMTTLRKFLVKCVAIPEPDRYAAHVTAAKVADMLGRMSSNCSRSQTTGGRSCVLLQHAATQLLPAFQVLCSSVTKGPVPALFSNTHGTSMLLLNDPATSASLIGAPASHLYPAVLTMYQQLAKAASEKAEIGIMGLLVGNQALYNCAAILSTNYWACPPIMSASLQPCNIHLTAQFAAEQVTLMLENLLCCKSNSADLESAFATANSNMHLRMSCSDDCLCAFKHCFNSAYPASNTAAAEGVCVYDSPRACSDVTAHLDTSSAPASHALADLTCSDPCVAATCGQDEAKQEEQTTQLQLLLAVLLQSKILPDLHRLLQQVSDFADGQLPAVVGGLSAELKQHSLSVKVPGPRTARSRDTELIAGESPRFSMLSQTAGSVRSSSTQQLLAACNNNRGSGALARTAGARFVTVGKRYSDGSGSIDFKAVAGTSPPVEGDVGGLLRAATNSWSSLAAAAEVQLASGSRQNSSGFDSTPCFASLAHPSSDTLCQDSFVSGVDTAVDLLGREHSGRLSGSGSQSSLQVRLQARLEAVLVAAGQAVLQLAESGKLGDVTNGGSKGGAISATSSCDVGSRRCSWSGDAAVPRISSSASYTGPVSGHGTRFSFSGSVGSGASQSGFEDVWAMLRASLAAPRPSAEVDAACRVQPAAAQGCAYSHSSEMLFPVDLGLAQMQLLGADQQHKMLTDAEVPSTHGLSAFEVHCGAVTATRIGNLNEVIKDLIAGLQATGPALSRACGTALGAEFSGHALMAAVTPRLVGCWNPGCVNLTGTSESVAAVKVCGNCKVARFCSKACEKMSWSSHVMVCAKLAALGQ